LTAGAQATLQNGVVSTDFPTLKDAVMAWHRLRPEQVSIGASVAAEGAEPSFTVNTIWGQYGGNDFFEDRRIYAIMYPTNDKWTVLLCSLHEPGGLLHRVSRSTARTQGGFRLPDKAFAAVPITGTLTRIAERLEGVIEATKNA
jgi:hypothetical protein